MSGIYILFIPLVLSLIIFTLCTISTQDVPKMNITQPPWVKQRMQGYRDFNNNTRRSSEKVYLFKDYIKKFNPNLVFRRIGAKKQLQGKNASVNEDFHEIFEGIDSTDELLRLNVETISSGRRKWRPLGRPDTEAPSEKDLFSLRQRFFELMRHTVYRTRNKLVIMQMLRNKYKNSSLYKMGFLMSKIDTACKSFAAYTYRAIHACVGRRYHYNHRESINTMMTSEERMVNKWFEIELLIDLLNENHENAKKVIEKYEKGRKEKWVFVD